MTKVKKLQVRSAKKHGFAGNAIHKRKEHPKQVQGYLKQKSSFLFASLSLVAFVAGNMVGQHGWYAFWKAALGQYDDSLIEYTGTVAPIEKVPDYTKWSAYGGDADVHTYKQVPKDLFISLPEYLQKEQKKHYDHAPEGDVYSVGFMGSYKTGAEGEGSHIGVDIRVPEGTPVLAIANGIVTRVADDPYGFGKLIVIRHPHAPDPLQPEYATVLHSGYAHLSAQLVSEGDIVKKGQQIALSGQTGFATGPHLHFQIDRDEAPWHPYWAFSYSESKAAGLTTAQAIDKGLHQERGYEYTVNPMLYIQAAYPAPKYKIEKGKTIVQKSTTPKNTVAKRQGMTVAERRQQRIAARGLPSTTVAVASVASSSSSTSSASVVVKTQTVAADAQKVPDPAPVLVVPPTSQVKSVEISHDRSFVGREWETVRVTLLDAEGNKINEDLLKTDLYMRTAYGEAEFEPEVLTSLDFKDGVAEVKMLPRSERTVVIVVQPFNVLSKPMEFKRK